MNPLKSSFKVWMVPGSYPVDPVKTIWMIWEQSRCDDPVSVMEERYERLLRGDNQPESDFPVDNKHPAERFRLLMEMEIPIVEFLHFSFVLEDIPVSFREQLVRHRIGSKIGPNTGVDDEPGVSDASFWSQTSRVRDLQNFFSEGKYYKPKQIADDESANVIFLRTLTQIQNGYSQLRGLGYPPEIARELLPSCTTHRIAWHVNLKSLKHIFGHRSCWIAMSDYWMPIISGVIAPLAELDPVFYALSTPPCISGKTNSYDACRFAHENVQRCTGRDPGIPCPLWATQEADNVPFDSVEGRDGYVEMFEAYKSFWGRDPLTGDPLPVPF